MMMGLGSFGNGGSSSSSSNLSALAPPFTVDRSITKPNSNPLVQFHETPYAAAPFNSSGHNYFPNSNSEVDLMPSQNVHRYLVPQSINSPNNTHMPAHMIPPLNPVVNDATDAYSFGHYSDSITTTSLVEAKPYYPSSYVSPAIRADNNPLVGISKTGYDLLSTSCAAPLNGSSQDDYTQSLSGLKYSSPWGGFWNGFADLESGRLTDFDGSFCSKEANVASSSIYKDYAKQGAVASKGLGTCGGASAVSHSINMLGGENCLGFSSAKQLDDKSFLPQNLKFIPVEPSRTSIVGSSSILPETPPQPPFLDSVMNSWNCPKPYSASYENCFRQHDMFLNDCKSAAKSSPSLVIRPPPVSINSSASSNTVSFINVNSVGSDAAGKNDVSAHNNPSTVKDSHLSLGSEGKEVCLDPSRLHIHLERNDRNIVDTSSTREEELFHYKTFAKDALDNLFKERSEFQVPPMSNVDDFSLADVAEAVNTVENSSKNLDQYNPAEDSPCWKGASASRFSPFEDSESVTPQLLREELETCNDLSLQGPQIFPLNTDDAVRVFSRKISGNIEPRENVCVENGVLPPVKRSSVTSYSFNDHGSDNAIKAESCFTKPSCGFGFQFSNDIHEPRKEDALPNNSKSDAEYKSSNATQPGLEEVRFTYEKKRASGTCVADTGMNVNDASEGGFSHVPFNATKHVLLSPTSGENGCSKLAKPQGGGSSQKMNAQMLVKAMHNLSELLLSHYSNDICALKEQDHETLKHVIKNLNACILKNAEQFSPTQESLLPQKGTSQFLGELPVLHQGASIDRPQVTNVAAASVIGQFDHLGVVPGIKDGKFQNFVSVSKDADIVKNDNVTQAIKKVLVENFPGGEETHPQVLMYKNLWLEAEAAICSINCRARFDRMKAKMEKCKSHEAKDVSENSMDVEKLSRAKVSPDVTTTERLTPKANDGIQDSSIISPTSHADDIIARFRILQSRVENSNSWNTTDAEKLSSKVSPDLSEFDRVAPLAKDNSTLDISVEDSPTSSKTSNVDDVEDSVMARFRILKCRIDNSHYMDMDEEPLPEDVDLGFVGERAYLPIINGSWDGSLDAIMGSDWQSHTAICTEDKLPEEESRLYVRDDTAIQSCGMDRLGNQLPAGWYDSSSSSEWEQVRKDEIAWPN